MSERIDAALADATARRERVAAELDAATRQFHALRAQGVELEKQLIGIDGEIKALNAVKE